MGAKAVVLCNPLPAAARTLPTTAPPQRFFLEGEAAEEEEVVLIRRGSARTNEKYRVVSVA